MSGVTNNCIFFTVGDRGRLSEDEICAQLLYILDDAPCLSNPPPVGLLTGWKRTLWAEAREDLMRDEKNARNLELITKSLLIICLDEPLPTSFNCRLQRGEWVQMCISTQTCNFFRNVRFFLFVIYSFFTKTVCSIY